MAEIVDSQPAGPASEERVAALEALLGFALPAEYRRFLLKHNGGRPRPDAITVIVDEMEDEDIVMCFFPAGDLAEQWQAMELEQLRKWPLHCAWKDFQSDLQSMYEAEVARTLLPIGTDGSGNYFCIVLDGEETGSVLFFEHEMGETSLLANNFDSFLDALRAREIIDEDDA